MKTLHLTNSWHDTSGGVATFYRALMGEANRREQVMRLVVPGEKDRVEECGKFGRIYHLEAPRSPLNAAYRTIYPTQFLRAGSKLQEILRAESPDLVEICDKYTLNYLGALLRRRLLPRLNLQPIVVGLSCERMDDNFRTYLGKLPLSNAFCSLYMKWLYFPFFDHHIANSEYTAAELRSAARGHLVERGTWIRHMGVDLVHLSPNRRSKAMRARLLENFGAPEDSVLLLYVGRLAPEKNLALLFDLLAQLSQAGSGDFRLLVVGDGIEREVWERDSAQRAPGRAHFFGHIKDRNVLADLYANADLFIHPNPREPFGIALLEAMASGLPLIAPNSGGVTSYASAENAWLAEATRAGFSRALQEALSNRELREAKAARALETARQHEWNRVASSFLDL
ncbi:MAG: glycosyltransferase, partial [Acidobacteria bacterium]|nr:glycosyltransferase [Acidobacteriota bacterium]